MSQQNTKPSFQEWVSEFFFQMYKLDMENQDSLLPNLLKTTILQQCPDLAQKYSYKDKDDEQSSDIEVNSKKPYIYQCDIENCKKVYCRRSDLTKHKNTVHNKEVQQQQQLEDSISKKVSKDNFQLDVDSL